jgi:hypothetical protein
MEWGGAWLGIVAADEGISRAAAHFMIPLPARAPLSCLQNS